MLCTIFQEISFFMKFLLVAVLPIYMRDLTEIRLFLRYKRNLYICANFDIREVKKIGYSKRGRQWIRTIHRKVTRRAR